MNKKQKTRQWFHKHINDPYVKMANKDGYRSRASYKLKELLDYVPSKQKINILELGSSPGGWTQVLLEKYPEAHITAIDLLNMNKISGVDFFQGDIFDPLLWEKIDEDKTFHAVLSDMMPNTSGIKTVDSYMILELLEKTMDVILSRLAPGGWFIIKFFEGVGVAQWRQGFQKLFTKVMVKKPQASRSESREQYLIGIGYLKD